MLVLNLTNKQNKKLNSTRGHMLTKIHLMLLMTQRRFRQHPKIVLAVLILSLIVFGAANSKLQFLLSIDDLIDPGFTTYQSLKKVNEEFKDKNTILLSIESDKAPSKKFLCDLQTWILNTAESRRDLIAIQSTFGVRQARIVDENLRLDSFLNLDCDTAAEEKEKILEAFKKIHESPWYMILTRVEPYTVTVNFIVHDPQDKKFGSIDTKVVGQLQTSFQQSFPSSNEFRTYWGGVTTYQSYLRDAFDFNFILNSLMFLFNLLIFRVFLGSWRAGLIYNGSLIICLIVTYGMMGYLNIPVDILTNSTGLMVIVSALEDFVFVTYGVLKNKWSLKKSLRRFILPAFITTLTTAIGFGSLVTSDLSIIRRFGVISAWASLFEWVVIFLFLPPLLSLFPSLSNFKFSSWYLKVKDPFQNKTPRFLAYFLILVVGVSLFFTSKLHVEDSPDDYFFKDHIVSQTSKHLLESRRWINEASLLFSNENSDAENQELIARVKEIDLVEVVESPYEVKDYLTTLLDRPDRLMMNSLLDETAFSKRLVSDRGTTRAQLFINSLKMEDVKRLITEVNEICRGRCELVGSLISYNEFSVRVLNTLFSSLGVSLALVILIIIAIRGPLSKWQLLACILSSIWGPLALLALFIVFDIPLFFVSCICASVLVGLAGDNAIQFIFGVRNGKIEESVDSLASASLIIAISMVILASVFLLSTMAPLAKLGFIMMVGFVLGYLGDVWILRGLLKK